MTNINLVYNPQFRLVAPKEYWALTPKAKAAICNGAGPRGKGWTVPDTMYGLRVTEPCNIHDFMYHTGVSDWDKLVADMVLLINLVLAIVPRDAPRWRARCPVKTTPVTWWRLKRALVYFLAVRFHGRDAFWAGKERPNGCG